MHVEVERLEDWRQSFVALEPWLRRWVRHKFTRADIDEVIQDTYLRLLSGGDDPAVHSHKAYLSRIARSVAIDHARRAQTRFICVAMDEASHEYACEAPLPDRQIEAQQRLERVSEKFAELPERHRRVVVMRRIEGMRSKQVAEELSLSVSSIEKHMTHTMRTLARAG